MNKKRFLVEFDESLKSYKSLNVPIPTVNVGDLESEPDYRYCDDCSSDYIEGENCNCNI